MLPGELVKGMRQHDNPVAEENAGDDQTGAVPRLRRQRHHAHSRLVDDRADRGPGSCCVSICCGEGTAESRLKTTVRFLHVCTGGDRQGR